LHPLRTLPQREFSKTALNALQALQHLLLACGHSLRGVPLYEQASHVQMYIKRAWREGRLPRFKVGWRAGARPRMLVLRLGMRTA
jgi:hypothetical protein